uniref:Uncharacterized protein n=1 Tax=Tanacetum cinerariifolium TaxID=118510 RepID=A0A699IFY5_TANCI|nr:hypothetical protein [Tanacetum cinerariifolium]
MFEAITIKTTIHKKLSINQECQDIRLNPSKDRDLDIGRRSKHSYSDQKAFGGGSSSDREEEEELKKYEICLMAHESNKYGNPSREGPKLFAIRPSTKLGQSMTNGREMTPLPCFSTPPHIPNINTTERPPVTTTVFAATTPGNTSFAYRASILTDPATMISLAFVEANHEILKSLLIDKQRQIRNEDLQTELEYFSKDYDEEFEMKPRL